MKRLRHANLIFKTEIEIIHKKINKQTLSFQEKSQKLQNTIKSQTSDIIHLKHSLENLQKDKYN